MPRPTLLAPDIVEAILAGRQLAEMTLAVLMRRFPVRWREQRAATLGTQARQAQLTIRLGLDHQRGGVGFRKAAELGVARSQTNLGLMLVQGEGIEPNKNEGFSFLLAAAQHGIPSAQQSVASLYARGIGTRPDVVQAYKWFRILERSRPAARRQILTLTTKMQKGKIDAAERAVQERRPVPTPFDEDALKP